MYWFFSPCHDYSFCFHSRINFHWWQRWPFCVCPCRPECQALGLTVLVDARRCSPVPALFKVFSTLQVSLELGQRSTGCLAVVVGCYISICCLCPPSATWLSIGFGRWRHTPSPALGGWPGLARLQTKQKNLSKSELGENTPPYPSKFAFISVLRTAHTPVSVLSWIILLGGVVCCTEGLCEMCRDFCLSQRRE